MHSLVWCHQHPCDHHPGQQKRFLLVPQKPLFCPLPITTSKYILPQDNPMFLVIPFFAFLYTFTIYVTFLINMVYFCLVFGPYIKAVI